MESITTEVLDDKQRRDTRGRRIMARERQAELLIAFDGSGLTQRAFARREGINFHTFVEWLQRRRRTAGTGAKQTPRFQELSLPFMARASGTLEVTLPGGVSVRGDNVASVVELVRALRT